MISAILTIGGHPISVDGSQSSQVMANNFGDLSEQSSDIDHYLYEGTDSAETRLVEYAYYLDSQYPVSLSGPYNGPAADNSYGIYRNYLYVNGIGFTYDTEVSFTNEYLSIGLADRVPEPSTWGLMILGFGAVGGVMRRKVRNPDAGFDAKIKQIEAGVLS